MSYKVMQENNFGDSVWYRVACDCGDPEHDWKLDLCLDGDFPLIYLHIYGQVHWWRGHTPWYRKITRTVKAVWKIIFTGWLDCEEELLILEEKHLKSFADALQEGIGLLEERREQREEAKK